MALERAGADVVELGPETVAKVDGLLLTGGPDIEPSLYNQDRVQETGKSDPDRDCFELELARRVREDGLPVLGICRGLQIAAVAFGGSLSQDVAGHKDPSLRHPVRIAEGSRFRQLAGVNELAVNSRHHQIVQVVPQDFRVTAVSPEGYVEGMESLDGQFLYVQCHPEDLQDEPWARALFADLVARAMGIAAQGPPTSAPDAPAAVEEAVQPRLAM
jgi:putative glutamine amidotransferase